MATIRDVAQRAGVSVATVSRLLNGTGKVREKTAERVHKAIRDLSFRPNALGRSLSTSQTQSIGVVIPSMSNPVFADAVAGINDEARTRGYTLMFTSTDYDRDEELRAVSNLLDYQVDGLILTVADPEHSPVLDMLDETGLPYVLIYNQPTDEKRPTVTIENVAAGREAADALAGLGHVHTGMVSGLFAASDRAKARREGFELSMARRGYPAPMIVEVDYVELDVHTRLAAILDGPDPAPTGLFCSNDLLAISVIGALRQLGRKVPKDISVIGFDGIAVGTHLHPTLATVVQPSREMGQTATRLLLDRLAGKETPAKVILPHTLRLGESVGPVTKQSPTDLQEPFQPAHRRPAS